MRPDLFNKFDLGRGVDSMGYNLFPRSLVSQAERTTAGIDMRFRFEPTINVSEEVRIKAQIDALDNILFGSTPHYAFPARMSRSSASSATGRLRRRPVSIPSSTRSTSSA